MGQAKLSRRIGQDHVPTYPSEPDKPCETRTASICAETTSFVSSVSGGATRTSTTTISTCATILGCNAEDQSTSTQVSTCSTKRRRDVPSTATAAQATAPVARSDSPPDSGSDCSRGPTAPAIIYPLDPKDHDILQAVRNALIELDLNVNHEVRSDRLDFTAFFWVDDVDEEQLEVLDGTTGVSAIQFKRGNWKIC